MCGMDHDVVVHCLLLNDKVVLSHAYMKIPYLNGSVLLCFMWMFSRTGHEIVLGFFVGPHAALILGFFGILKAGEFTSLQPIIACALHMSPEGSTNDCKISVVPMPLQVFVLFSNVKTNTQTLRYIHFLNANTSSPMSIHDKSRCEVT